MTLQTHPVIEKASEVSPWAADRHTEPHESEAFRATKSILVDTAVDAGALIDAVLCRCGDWVDWERYRPFPGIRADDSTTDFLIRLALVEDIFGLRHGGYIEMRVARDEKVVEVCGGYYDAHDQPEPVIDGSLRWNEVNHQELGQMLLLMYDRIVRAHLAGEISGATARSAIGCSEPCLRS